MNRVDRLLAQILYLQSRPLCTADEMAEHFGLSLRTIYRDLAALGEAGVPLMAQAGVGYSLARGYHLPPVSFTTEEASALVTGGLLVERSADASVKRPMRSALMKVRAVLPRALQAQMVRLEQSMATTATPGQPEKGADLTLLQQALSQRQTLRFTYLGWNKKEPAERVVEPLGLVHYLERWHLIAWCRLRKEVRDFRTDRMSRVSMLREVFEPRPDFAIADYIQSMPRPELRAEVRFTPPAVDRATGMVAGHRERTRDSAGHRFDAGIGGLGALDRLAVVVQSGSPGHLSRESAQATREGGDGCRSPSSKETQTLLT